MKTFAFAASLAVLATSLIVLPAAPARANAFCPVTVSTVMNLAQVGQPSTYGVFLDVDPGDATSVRMRVDSSANRYAVDFNDLTPASQPGARIHRYFTMPVGEKVVAAWIESTGTSPEIRTECPVTRPFQADAPPLSDPRTSAAIDADKRSVLDSFSTRTPLVTPQSFGKFEPRGCTQPYAPPRAINAADPEMPAEASAVHASGSVIVRVDLDETSSPIGGTVVRSSGFAPLDRSALNAALKSTYKTETFACRPIAASYQYAITFKAPQ
jgi:TonB family protein